METFNGTFRPHLEIEPSQTRTVDIELPEPLAKVIKVQSFLRG
jgi:hypothetical protein